jgi:hypothetical protein
VRIVLAILLPLACVLTLTQVIERAEGPVATDDGRGNAVVWADRVFTSRAQLADWLEVRGTSYESWVKRHPNLSPWEPAAPAASERGGRAAAGDGKGGRTEAAGRGSEPRPTGDDGGLGFPGGLSVPSIPFNAGAVFLAFAALLGMGMIAVSAVPPMLYAGRATAAGLLIDRRAQVGAAGLSLLVGVGIPILTA